MTEEETVQKSREPENQNIRDEEILQDRLENINNTTKKVNVTQSKMVEFQCTKNGTDRYSVTLYNPELEINLNLRNVLPNEKAVEFVEEYKDGQKVYATFLNLIVGGSEVTYLGDISTNKSDAEKVASQFKNEATFSIEEKGRELVYGNEQKVRKYLPKSLDSKKYRITKGSNLTVAVISLFAVLYLISNFVPVLFLVTLLLAVTILPIGYYIAKNTNKIYRTEVDPEALKTGTAKQISVLECTYKLTNEELIIKPTDEDTKWVFEKDKTGSLPDEGKKALKQMREIGSTNKAMLPVTEPSVNDSSYILSEDEQYTIPE